MKGSIIFLYKIANKINKKVYIGQTNNPSRRWSCHKNNAKKDYIKQYIHHAMKKYGIFNFTFEIISCCKSLDDANQTEELLIEQYNSRDKNCGYNLRKGGNVGKAIKKREMISSVKKGKKL